tara:strand:+ start:2099 stop:4573 length:2475 start_codon:yes stop_codon:yes gene_type:complete
MAEQGSESTLTRLDADELHEASVPAMFVNGVILPTDATSKDKRDAHLSSSEISWRSHAAAEKARHVRTKEVIKKQLESYERGIINPRTNPYVPFWDTATFLCLMFTAIITPFEVCLIQEPGWIWSVVNWVVNAFFIADMILQFFLAYQESPKKGSRWVVHRPAIIRHYVRTWFFLDLFSSIDFQLIGNAILSQYEGNDDSVGNGTDPTQDSTNLLRLIRGIRLVRLVKLLRILRASRIIARWQNFVGLSFAQLSMIKFAVITVFLVHLLACFWAYWGINWKKDDDDLIHETSWVIAGGFEPWIEDSPVSLYTVAFYVAVVAMFGGVGSIVPHNYYEYMAITIMMVFGSFVWAWVIGSLCGILATLNPHATNFRNTMDELNYFMHESGFTQAHRVRLREFFRQTEDFVRTVAYNDLLAKMSAQLKGDTALLMGEETLRNVWYLHSDNVEKEFLAVVALNMHHAVYEARELIPVNDLTVLLKGMTAMRLRIITKGGVFGEDAIIEDRHIGLRDLCKVNCLTFTQVVFISRSTIFDLVESFPAAKSWLQRAAKILTLRAGMKKYYAAYKREIRRRREDQGHRSNTRHVAMIARNSTLQSMQHEAGLAYNPASDGLRISEENLETERQSAATIYADLMHQKRMEMLTGVSQPREDESKDYRLRRSMSTIAEKIENTRYAAQDQTERIDNLTRQQQLMDQKMELQLTMITQLIASQEKRDKRDERGYESAGTDTSRSPVLRSKSSKESGDALHKHRVTTHTRRVKKVHQTATAVQRLADGSAHHAAGASSGGDRGQLPHRKTLPPSSSGVSPRAATANGAYVMGSDLDA